MENIITHFGHDHPLTFFEEEGDYDYKPNSICSICHFPILSSPSYACTLSNCAGFFLHQPCALLPQTFPYPRYPEKQYTLISPPPKAECRKCRKPIQNFAYAIRWSNEVYYIHPMCAKAVEIKMKHKSHPQHPLVAIHKEMGPTECDACGEEHKGVFFSCGARCSFWIHKDCASSPSVVKLVSHKHPLILTYIFNNLYDYTRCISCKEHIFGQGLYFCARTWDYYHMKCVSTSDVQILDSESQKEYWISLPNERHRFPNWIKNFSEYMIREDITYSELLEIWFCHNNHPLTFHENYPAVSSSKSIVVTRDGDEDEDEDEDELVCDGCTKPIFKTSPIWGCFEPDCDFLLHHWCATNLPSDSEYWSYKLLIRKPGNSKYFFCSMFFCFLCGRPSNGFGCSIANKHSNLCVECAFSPKTATHESHHGGLGQHILFLAHPGFGHVSCCSSALLEKSVTGYSCVSCEFRIHIGCAQLPKKVNHPDFHKHPLELVFTNDKRSFKKLEDCFCEFCEEDINQQYWFYRCAECDQSFHVKCIPSVGLLSNVKFGGRLNIPNIHPRHPVILTRMLMEGNQRCDYNYCRKIINGFVDDMAFRCDECDFWIHFRCARDCSTTAQRDLYKPRLWYYKPLDDYGLHLWNDVISKGILFE